MISLRNVTPQDQDRLREWRNHPEVRKYMLTDHEIGYDEHRTWFAKILLDHSSRYWIIVCDGEDVGVINLYNIDEKNLRCRWGFYIVSPDLRGRGVGSQAWFAVLRYVFEELKLLKLCSEVLASNERVIAMHKSFGFVQEGILREHVLKASGFADVVCLTITREEWQARKPELEASLTARRVV